MCFAPQRCALFRHLNFQKWSDPLVICPFWLGNVLRATTPCTFSCLIWPAGSAPAALASLLFALRSHKSVEKHSKSRLSYLFAHLPLFSSNLVSSDSSHLCFSTVHIVGSFTSKLPSATTNSLLPSYSLLPTAYCLLLTASCFLLPASCLLLAAYYLLLTAYCLLLTAYYLLLTTSYFLLTTYYLLLTTYYLLHTTSYFLLPTSYFLLTT